MLRVLRHRDFALLWIGQAVSLLGDGIYVVAIAWLVYDISNAPSALGLVGLAWTLPQVATLLLAGVVTRSLRAPPHGHRRRPPPRRRDRRPGPAGARRTRWSSGTWSLLVIVYGVGEALFQPAFTAIVPEVVPQDEILQASALKEVMEPIGFRFAGPAIGGLLIATGRRGHGVRDRRGDLRGVGRGGEPDVAPATPRVRPGHVDLARAAGGLRLRAGAPLAVGHARLGGARPAGQLRPVRGAAPVPDPQRSRRRTPPRSERCSRPEGSARSPRRCWSAASVPRAGT